MLFSREGEFPVSGKTQLNRTPIEIFPKEVTISFELFFDEAPEKKFNILHLRSKNGPYIFDVESTADEDGLIAFSCFRDKANPEIVTDTFAVFPGEWFKITFSQFMTDSGYHFGLNVDGRNVFDMIPNPNPFDFTGVTVHASLDKKVRQPVKMRNFVIEDAETTDSILEISDLVSESSDLTLQRSAANKDCIEDLPSDFDDTLETGKMLEMNPTLMSTLLTPRKSPKIEKSESAKEDKKEKDVSFEPFQESGMTILEPPEDDNDEENAEVFEDDRETQNTTNETGSNTSRTPHNSSSLPFEADPDMDKETRELIMSLLEEDEVRIPRPPPSRESRPSLPLETIAPVTSQRHLERRSAPDYSSYVPPREFSSTTVSGNHKEMRIGEVPETLSRETKHTRVRIRRKGPQKRLYF